MTIEFLGSKEILRTVPFAVEEIDLTIGGKAPTHPYHRIRCPDWVNVLPVTSNGEAIMIKQVRSGPEKWILETPGGVLEASERDATMAAVRELEEETGYTSQRVLPLGALNPNPAIQNNKVHMFVALGCYLPPERKHFPDIGEAIEVVRVPITELVDMVYRGEVDHCLSALCIMLAQKYLPRIDKG